MPEGTIDTKNTQKRVGTGWDGRRSTREVKSRTRIITGPTKQGNKRWRRPKKDVDWSTDKGAMGGEKAGGRCGTKADYLL
ncbi:hypothetical protein BY996DRAFT_6578855 [Phakopsora pachyrhizi]|nr:hypothetical protein BY996DRAFT_6578855 [Phakopsora pachyrhizi]